MIAEMGAEENIKSGHWIWSYNNLNIHQCVRHERIGKNKLASIKLHNVHVSSIDHHNKIENTTTRLAVRIHNYPPYEIDWNDTSPQRSRCSLGENDILPSDEDARNLNEHMLKFVMSFIVKKLRSLSDLAQFLPSESFPAHKSEIIPLKLLFRDEKSIDENIQILVQYTKDANLDGSPQVIGY